MPTLAPPTAWIEKGIEDREEVWRRMPIPFLYTSTSAPSSFSNSGGGAVEVSRWTEAGIPYQSAPDATVSVDFFDGPALDKSGDKLDSGCGMGEKNQGLTSSHFIFPV